jgi:hypothetical protein
MTTKLNVPGHSLMQAGRPYKKKGNGYVVADAARDGVGLCTCGATSPQLVTNNQRKKWHLGHRQEIIRTVAGVAEIERVREALLCEQVEATVEADGDQLRVTLSWSDLCKLVDSLQPPSFTAFDVLPERVEYWMKVRAVNGCSAGDR